MSLSYIANKEAIIALLGVWGVRVIPYVDCLLSDSDIILEDYFSHNYIDNFIEKW